MIKIEPVESAYADEVFKNHRAEYEKLEGKLTTIEWLKWKNPDSGFHSAVYIRSGGTLTVYGDMFEAVYQWHEAVTLKWISQCDLGYFYSKCKASPQGREFKRWDGEALKERVESAFKDQVEEEQGTDGTASEKFERFADTYGDDCMDSEHEWYEWCNSHAQDFFGEGAEDWPDGWIMDNLCELQYEGLKRAIAQLDASQT